VGQIVKVKVIKVDKELPRVSLSIKALLPAERKGHALRSGKHRHAHPEEAPAQQPQKEVAGAKQERPSWARSNDRAADGGGRNKRRDGRPSRRDRKDVQTRRIQPSQQQRQGDTAPLVNTQLADQLAALKEQMGKN
jgi:predicted RNA-binding protein with RPS1 domain